MKIYAGALSVLTGWAVADYMTRFTHLLPGYGYSQPGDDPLALAIGVIVGVLSWKIARRLTR